MSSNPLCSSGESDANSVHNWANRVRLQTRRADDLPFVPADRVNPPGEIRIERFGWNFCSGDKVMQRDRAGQAAVWRL